MSAYTIGALICGVLAVPSAAYVVALFVHFHRQGQRPSVAPRPNPLGLCSNLRCDNPATSAPHGWAVCDDHAPAEVAS